ncbi:jg8919 [Pararge aegeria aegeria]|uniref:Jg8919 protein n=1 Tax=Pararge aegeria aegeria TaxID=348720 RepID=A0A8S4SN11_9NEOP|nr:jg8919 [Pararge aegeria aegeria]
MDIIKYLVTYSLDRYGEIVDPDNCGRMFSTCYQPPKVEKTRACNPVMSSAMKFISAATTTLPRVHD